MCDAAQRRAVAVAYYRGSDVSVLQLALDTEVALAKALGGRVTPHNHAVDIVVDDLCMGVEVKTIQSAHADRVCMNRLACKLKRDYARANGLLLITVVVDYRFDAVSYYVRDAVGGFRLGSMQKMHSPRAIRLYLLKCASQRLVTSTATS
jgi:hypothetical protein